MQQRVTSCSIALTLLGAVIGAGFASGQEVEQFFSHCGKLAGWAVAVSAAGFLLLAIGLTRICLRLRLHSFPGLLQALAGKAATTVFRHVFALSFFIGLTVMISGSAAMLGDLFGLPKLLTGCLTAGVVYYVSSQRVQGLAGANVLLMPCFLFLFLFYWLRSFAFPAVFAGAVSVAPASWFWSGLLYVAFNSSILLVVIPPLTASTGSAQEAYRGVTAFVAVFCLLLLLVVHLLGKFSGVTVEAEMPLLVISAYLVPVLPWLYALPLWIALATTAFADAAGLQAYLEENLPQRSQALFIVLLGLTAVLSQFRFAALVGFFYPLIGYVCVIFYCYCFGRWLYRSLTA